MKKQCFFVANWKLYLSFQEIIKLITTNHEKLIKLASENKLLICPPYESIYAVAQILKETGISIGAQNCSHHLQGSFTGQVSAKSLREIGCSYCIVGHSEARRDLCETSITVAMKLVKAINGGLNPILCIGESEQEFKSGKTLSVLEAQLKPVFEILKTTNIPNYITPYIAYEPSWSIGSGDIASTEHIETVLAWLSTKTKWKLIYGGGISSKNIALLKKIEKIDGFLIGSASLDFQEFEKVVQ